MLSEEKLLTILNHEHSILSKKQNIPSRGVTIGVVVDTDDPLQQGRLRVFCPTLNDDPKKLLHLPWAVYVSPFGGSISNNSFTRGAGKGPETSNGATHYGFWGIPEQGAHVLVACIDEDDRRRIWIGCIPEHQETHTMFHGRYEWGGSGPDGPLTSRGSPVEPAYTNMSEAFQGNKDSAEWKSRGADYQATAVREDEGTPNDEKESYLDEQFPEISESEKDAWVKPIVGAHGYDWSANKGVGSHLASKVYGFSTPGFHALSMDDRAYNSRIRLRSATGHQILMDDTNERIYISTNEGKNYIEMDSSGNIEIYTDRRLSVNSKKDINFSTDETFRVKAKKGIHMYSGDTRGQESLDDGKPEDGEIRFHSTADFHVMSEKNYRQLVENDKLVEIGDNYYSSVGDKYYMQVENEMNTIVNEGDYNIVAGNDYNHHATRDTSIFSGNDQHMQAINDSEMFSYTGKMDIGSQLEMTVKSYEKDIGIEAIEESIKMISQDNMNHVNMNSGGIFTYSDEIVHSISQSSVETSVSEDFSMDEDEGLLINGSPVLGCLTIPGINIKFGEGEALFNLPDNFNIEWGDGLMTSIDTIQDSLDQIEERVNDILWSTALNFLDLASKTDLSTYIGISLPTSPPSPNVFFPSIDLPDFNFDFCVDYSQMLKVDTFNFSPHQHFLNIGGDLGGLTLGNINRWYDVQKDKFDTMISNFNLATAEGALQLQIQLAKNNISIMISSLDDLINISLTDNNTYLANYSGGTEGLKNAINDFNSGAGGVPEVNSIPEFENTVDDHRRSMEQLSEIANKGNEIEGYDFSNLQDSKTYLEGVLDDIGGP